MMRLQKPRQVYTFEKRHNVRCRKKCILAMMNVNIGRFKILCSICLYPDELKLMEGSAQIISLIARDEAQHLALSSHVLKNWMRGEDDPDMAKIAKECEDEVYEMWKACVEEEKAWAKYLMKDGSIIGLNERLLGSYVEYIANRRLKALGYKPVLIHQPQNPPWTQHWLSLQDLLHQETEESYIYGIPTRRKQREIKRI